MTDLDFFTNEYRYSLQRRERFVVRSLLILIGILFFIIPYMLIKSNLDQNKKEVLENQDKISKLTIDKARLIQSLANSQIQHKETIQLALITNKKSYANSISKHLIKLNQHMWVQSLDITFKGNSSDQFSTTGKAIISSNEKLTEILNKTDLIEGSLRSSQNIIKGEKKLVQISWGSER